ncbi:MAG: hypothetical protein AB1775_03510 [Bacteroidota bacterium]
METTETKTYKIGEREFVINSDLTLRQRQTIIPIIKKFSFENATISANLTMEELCEFYSAILKPVDEKPVEKNFFELIDEWTEIEVCSFFFLNRVELLKNIQNFLKSSTQNSKTFGKE